MEGIRQQGEAPEETNRADLAISCDSRKAKHRHVVQFPLGMNLLRDLIDLEMLWLGIKQNEIGVEMKRGRECSAAVILLPNDVLAACLQCRTNERSQTRLVIDKENALASSHQDQPRPILYQSLCHCRPPQGGRPAPFLIELPMLNWFFGGMSTQMKKTAASANFEQAMKRLEEIVEQMESGDLLLEDLILRYEEGMKLVKLCQERLASAEERIEIITRNSAGKAVVKEFEAAATPPAASPEPKGESKNADVSLF